MKRKVMLPFCIIIFMQVANAQLNAVFTANGDTVNHHPFIMCNDSCFDFLISVTGGTPPYTYLWNNGSTSEAATYCTADMVNFNDTIMIAVYSSDYQSNSFSMWAPNYININQEICLVSVDNYTNKNKIIWNQNSDTTITLYHIYKETATLNQYELIGSVSRDSVSVFIDTTSNPAQVSAKYKMYASDGCAESLPSPTHKTMHLILYPGVSNTWNLIWTPYQGNNYSIKNRIWRGSTSMGLELIDSVSSSVTTYTDLMPPTGVLYYAIEMIPQYSCSPSAKNNQYLSSFSNTADNTDYVGIESEKIASDIMIIPNPVTDKMQIISDFTIQQVEIYDAIGRTLLVTTLLDFDIGHFVNGVYFLRLTTDRGVIQKKFIKH